MNKDLFFYKFTNKNKYTKPELQKTVNMFENLPIEIENHIYKIYFSKNVLTKIGRGLPIYITMSNELVDLINKDNFSGDPKYFLNDDDKSLLCNFEDYMCLNCFAYGFMCSNCDEDRIGYKRINNIYNRKIYNIFNTFKNINNLNTKDNKFKICNYIRLSLR